MNLGPERLQAQADHRSEGQLALTVQAVLGVSHRTLSRVALLRTSRTGELRLQICVRILFAEFTDLVCRLYRTTVARREAVECLCPHVFLSLS